MFRPHPLKLLDPLGMHSVLAEAVEGYEGLHPVESLRKVERHQDSSFCEGLFQREEGGRGPPSRYSAV